MCAGEIEVTRGPTGFHTYGFIFGQQYLSIEICRSVSYVRQADDHAKVSHNQVWSDDTIFSLRRLKNFENEKFSSA